MPLPATANMNLVLPSPHDPADSDIWGDLVNTAVVLIDQHDHTTGKGVPIPVAALRINADVAWSFGGSNFAITSMRALDFATVTAASVNALASALFVNSDDANNLYFRNQGGTNVKITDGGTLNVSIVGGIGGDYSAVGALVSFSDANNAYLFQQQGAPRPWAIMQCGDLDIFQAAASIVNRVKLKSPAALAASYDLTLPTALPLVTSTVSCSPTGQLAFDTHGDRVLTISAAAFTASTATDLTMNPGGTTPVRAVSGTPTTAYLAIPLRTGDRIKSVVYSRLGDGVVDTVDAVVVVTAAGGSTTIFTGSESNITAAWADRTANVTDTVLAAGETVTLQIATGANLQLGNVRITYDRP